MYNPEKIEEYAKVIYDRYEYFNNYTLETIARRIKATGQLSAADGQALKNIADISGDMQAVTKKLAEITRMNIADIEKIYTQVITDGVNTYKPLYDFKGMKFVPFEENEFAQVLVRHWAKETVGEMINLSRTKALGFDKTDIYGNVIGSVPLKGAYEQVISEAVAAVSGGSTDFNTAMAKTVERLGGSGVKVTYGSGVNRSLSAMVRQNILYGAKRSAQAYDEYIDEKLGCDGFEVDAHSGCRPSHMFMQGRMYSYSGIKVIGGVVYEDGAQALKALGDYGCLHYKTDVILGVSRPRYTQAELNRIEKETTELIEYDGKEKTLYEWKQTQRRIERGVRCEQQKADMFDAAGMKRKALDCKDRVKLYRDKYDDMCARVNGLEPRLDRMRTFKDFSAKSVDISAKSGIMKEKSIKSKTEVTDVHYIGKIDINIYNCITSDIITDDVIITNERIQHIKERHPNDFEMYCKYMSDIVQQPEYIIEANKPNTALVLKSFSFGGEQFKTILRLVTSIDDKNYKNSVITFMKIDEKEWNRLIKNKKILYKQE